MSKRRIALIAAALAVAIATLVYFSMQPSREVGERPAYEAGDGRRASPPGEASPRLAGTPPSSQGEASAGAPSDPPHPPQERREPTSEEIARLGGPVEGRAVEVVVLRGSVPEPGARVRAFDPGENVAGEAFTDEEGRARIAVATAIGHRVEIEAEGLPAFSTDVIVRETGSWRPVVVLGTGSIAGRAYDQKGQPLVRQPLWLLNVAPGVVGTQTDQRRETDADGRFRFEGLHSGPWLLKCEPRSWTPETSPAHGAQAFLQLRIPLRLGEERRVDLGAPGLVPLWEGRVSYDDDTPVETARALVLRRSIADLEVVFGFAVADGGRFRVPLAPGPWRARVWLPQGIVPVPRHVHPAPGGAEQVVIDGSRLVGRVRNAPEEGSVSWGRPGDANPSGRVALGPGGVFVIDGLPEGKWALHGMPFELRDGRGEEPVVEVLPGGGHLSADLEAVSD